MEAPLFLLLGAGASAAPSLGPSATGPEAGEPAGVGAAEISDSGAGADSGVSAAEGPEAGEPSGVAEMWFGEGAAEALGDEAGEGAEALGDGEVFGEPAGEGEGAEADTDPTTAKTTMASTTSSRAIFLVSFLYI